MSRSRSLSTLPNPFTGRLHTLTLKREIHVHRNVEMLEVFQILPYQAPLMLYAYALRGPLEALQTMGPSASYASNASGRLSCVWCCS